MIVYIENSIDSTKKLPDLINEFGKTAGYKVNIQKSKAFFTITMRYQKQKLGNKHNYYSNKRNKTPKNTPNQGCKKLVLRKVHNTEKRN